MPSGETDKEVDQLLALHATLVSTACASETKRQSVSVTSTALISAGIAIFAADKGFTFAFLVVPFLIISSIWFVTVRFYQELARAKWDVVHEIEKGLVFAPFTTEWKCYKRIKRPFTFGPSTLEQIIPALIFIFSFGYGAIWLFFRFFS